ncbi:MAG TPA: hypothetical protein PK794_02525, partial [Armatimonadota bacterium]|nr:hypothetical protein [Armatimonadota bacterium]
MSRLCLLALLLLAVVPLLADGPALWEPADKAAGVAIPVTLRWQGEATARYECDVARDAGFTDSALIEKGGTGASRALSHLLPGVTYYWRAREVGGEWSAARSFTTDAAVPAGARGGRIVLVNGRQIAVMNGDGSGLTPLAALPMPAHPALSPDGRLIAFTSAGNAGLYGAGGLYLMRADGSGLRKLCPVAGRAWRPCFSPAGDVYFALGEDREARWRLCHIRADGTAFTRLAIPAGMQNEPALSEDGTLLLTSGHLLTLYNADTGAKLATLPNAGKFQQQEPCFSRDGASILTTAYADGRMKLLRLFTDGSGETCLATADRVSSPCVSPDGSVIQYSDEKGLRRIGPDGKIQPFAAGLFTSTVYPGMHWQAAPGRWSPEPPALAAPNDGATAVPVPAPLRWAPLVGVTGYMVQVATTKDFAKPAVELPRVFGGEALVEGLAAETTYYWRIRARFRDEAGAWSPARRFTTGAAAPRTYGLIRGTLIFEGGGPLAKERVTLTIGTQTSSYLTGDDGTFAGVAPAGAGIIRAEGAEAPVTITAGKAAQVALVRTPTSGVVITATQPDGKPFTGNMTGASRKRTDDGRYDQLLPLTPRAVGPGVFWFPTVRPDDIELAVILGLRGTFMHGNVVRRWVFPKREAVRRLTVTAPPPVHVRLILRDDAGHPLRNTRVDGRIGRWWRDPYDFWPDSNREGFYSESPITMGKRERLTDDQGRLDLEMMVAGTCDLNVRAAGHESARVTLVIKEDGTYAPDACTLRAPRTVTQTVFTPGGAPAAGARVFASFVSGGEVTIRRGTADARGRVTWEGLPHRRVIVSGAGVAAGVIPAEGAEFPARLPAPAPEKAVKFHLEPGARSTHDLTFGVVLHTPEKTEFRKWVERLTPGTVGW